METHLAQDEFKPEIDELNKLMMDDFKGFKKEFKKRFEKDFLTRVDC